MIKVVIDGVQDWCEKQCTTWINTFDKILGQNLIHIFSFFIAIFDKMFFYLIVILIAKFLFPYHMNAINSQTTLHTHGNRALVHLN